MEIDTDLLDKTWGEKNTMYLSHRLTCKLICSGIIDLSRVINKRKLKRILNQQHYGCLYEGWGEEGRVVGCLQSCTRFPILAGVSSGKYLKRKSTIP